MSGADPQTAAAGTLWASNAQHADGCEWQGWMPVLVDRDVLELLVESQPALDEPALAARLAGRVVCPSCATSTQLPAASRSRDHDPFASHPVRPRRRAYR